MPKARQSRLPRDVSQSQKKKQIYPAADPSPWSNILPPKLHYDTPWNTVFPHEIRNRPLNVTLEVINDFLARMLDASCSGVFRGVTIPRIDDTRHGGELRPRSRMPNIGALQIESARSKRTKESCHTNYHVLPKRHDLPKERRVCIRDLTLARRLHLWSCSR